jgi:CTP:molybdopterin cytidylyltransferase MocA
MNLGAVLLAAGSASRYGSPKQLLQIEGQTLVRRAAQAILDAGAALTVVTGAYAEAVAGELHGLPLRVVHNANWQLGMGGSIACGFRALMNDSDTPSAALLCLADQPRVGLPQLRRLLERHEPVPESITVSDYGDARGPPCVFPSAVYAELAALEGNAGARAVLARHRERIRCGPMPEAAMDIDTPEDWERLRRGE